jgi:Ser/Thr protein kinase RdoA (MazF antagonist)
MALLKEKPQITLSEVPGLIEKFYGLSVSAKALPGERDLNFHLKDTSGKQYVCKIANSGESIPFLEAQTKAMVLLREKNLNFGPEVLASTDGRHLIILDGPGEEKYYLRLLGFLIGTPLAEVKEPSLTLMADLGRILALMDKAFLEFDHPALHREFYWDLAQAPSIIEKYSVDVTDEKLKQLIDSCLQLHEDLVLPRLEGLRQSVLHNDANDHNVLVEGDRVVGLLDFGDMIYSHTVNDLAIAVAYMVLDQKNISEVMDSLVESYHKTFALNEDELEVIKPLACLRLATSICVAAHQMKLEPENKYLAVSQRAVQETLPKMLALTGKSGT